MPLKYVPGILCAQLCAENTVVDDGDVYGNENILVRGWKITACRLVTVGRNVTVFCVVSPKMDIVRGSLNVVREKSRKNKKFVRRSKNGVPMQKYCTWTVLLSWEFSPKETCRTLKIILAPVTFISVWYGSILCENYLFFGHYRALW